MLSREHNVVKRSYLQNQVGADIWVRGDPLVRCPGTVVLLLIQTAVSYCDISLHSKFHDINLMAL